MAENPRVSIVTISYNQGQYLERAIQSVLSQTYDNIEYILVDAGSTDESLSIIDRYRKRISSVICEPDDGPANGLNKGFSHADGDIFGYINADDYYLPDAIEKTVKFFNDHPDADIVSGHCYIVNEMTGKLSLGISDRFEPLKASLRTRFLMQQSTFFLRDAYMSSGGFNDANGTCWDVEFVINACLAGKQVVVYDEVLSVFRIHHDSVSGSAFMYNEYLTDMNNLFHRLSGRQVQVADRYRRFVYNLERIPQRIRLIPFCLKKKFTGKDILQKH